MKTLMSIIVLALLCSCGGSSSKGGGGGTTVSNRTVPTTDRPVTPQMNEVLEAEIRRVEEIWEEHLQERRLARRPIRLGMLLRKHYPKMDYSTALEIAETFQDSIAKSTQPNFEKIAKKTLKEKT